MVKALRDRIMRLIATVVAVAALLATVLAACGSSDVDVVMADDSATAPGGDSSTSGSVADESSGGEGDSDGVLLEAETTPAGHEESFIESRRENLYEPEHVGGAGESALRAAGCEVFGSETWICPDETNLSGADLSGMSLPFARMRGALLFGADLSGVDAAGADFRDIYAPTANLSGAVLTGASLSGADLSFGILSGADFAKTQMYGITLSGSDLSGSNSTDSNLVRRISSMQTSRRLTFRTRQLTMQISRARFSRTQISRV